jgi:hypothetical protein
MLGVSLKRVTNMRWEGNLAPATTPHQRSACSQVEALAEVCEARRLEAEQRRAQQPETSRVVLPPDQEATSEELRAAAEWNRDNPGPFFVHTERAAQILGVTPQYGGRLAAQERLPRLPKGRSGGQPTREYRRAQIEVIARAKPTHQRRETCLR